jgi:hypothetical protein
MARVPPTPPTTPPLRPAGPSALTAQGSKPARRTSAVALRCTAMAAIDESTERDEVPYLLDGDAYFDAREDLDEDGPQAFFDALEHQPGAAPSAAKLAAVAEAEPAEAVTLEAAEVSKPKRRRRRSSTPKTEPERPPPAPRFDHGPPPVVQQWGALTVLPLSRAGRGARLSDEMLDNLAGQRGADHVVPLGTLRAAVDKLISRKTADEPGPRSSDARAANGAYFYPVEGTSQWLIVVARKLDTGPFSRLDAHVVTAYFASAQHVEHKIGRGFRAWSEQRPVLPNF